MWPSAVMRFLRVRLRPRVAMPAMATLRRAWIPPSIAAASWRRSTASKSEGDMYGLFCTCAE